MTRFIPRSAWGLPDPQGQAAWQTDRSNRTGFVVHWDGGETPTTEQRVIELMLAYHRYHISVGNGFFDYNLAVSPVTGDIYEGRGLDTIGAHAGGANTPNIGVILVGGPGNLTEAGKQGLRDAYALACNHVGRALAQRVHSDINSTGCPGDEIRRWVHAGGLSGGGVPAGGSGGGSSLPYQPGTITVGVSVAQVQERLVAHGFDVGPHGIDNQMGDDTIAAILAFQTAEGIDRDAVVGPDTWGRLAATPGAAPTGLSAPPFPLPGGWYFGPQDGPEWSVSGFHGRGEGLRVWQQRMRDRGWDISVDGLYGTETAGVARAFQTEKGLTVDGLIGPETWTAAWTTPIT